jgi:hypothetical protein
MNTIERRLERLEEKAGQHGEELIIEIQHFSRGVVLPDRDEEIARQRAEGKKIIVVKVPAGDEIQEG